MERGGQGGSSSLSVCLPGEGRAANRQPPSTVNRPPPQEEAELLKALNRERPKDGGAADAAAAAAATAAAKASGASAEAPAAVAAADVAAGKDEATMAARLNVVYSRLQEIDAYGEWCRGAVLPYCLSHPQPGYIHSASCTALPTHLPKPPPTHTPHTHIPPQARRPARP